MFQRKMKEELLEAAKGYPVVTLMGPRQSGKTTLVKEVFPDKPYVNLERLHMRELANNDPEGFLNDYPEGAILDEIQAAPHLLSAIQVRVDESKKKGEFILTGSHQMALHEAISQSMAGRTAILNLLPLSLEELQAVGNLKSLDDLLFEGCYPAVQSEGLNPTKTYGNYVATYLEKDIRKMMQVHNIALFEKFLILIASRIGQILNKESLAGEVGVDAKTIGNWLSILEACYIIYRLHPYFENFGKRVIKSPKVYFCDVGLASYLLGIENRNQISRDPLRGNLVENLVVMELMKARFNRGLDPRLYFYQVSGRTEVDLIFQRGRELVPIEIKSSKTFNSSFLDGIKKFQQVAKGRTTDSYLVYGGDEETNIQGIQLLNFRNSYQIVRSKNLNKAGDNSL